MNKDSGIPLKQLQVDGGMTNNKLLMQLQADILCIPVVDLKSHINDLQEANENAVLELAKADEEISQLKADVAKLKTEYEDRPQDSHSIVKEKVSRKHGEPLSPISPGNSLDLHGEVCQLRSESRKLREANHRLNEENHWLQEELWDMRRQHERLLRTILNGTTDSTERGDGSSLAQIIEHNVEHNGKVDRVTSLQSKFERMPSPAHCRSVARGHPLSSSWVKKEAGLVMGSEDTH
ncbi:UNVERIFIED_CONTAM: hypothetical protein FKN15_078176 [Acipenser sinensis]